MLSLSWNFFVSHDKYIARPSSRATLIHRQYNGDWGTSYSRPPIDLYLTSPLLQNPGGATGPSIRLFIIDLKNVQIKIKNVKNVKNVTKNTFVNVIKNVTSS